MTGNKNEVEYQAILNRAKAAGRAAEKKVLEEQEDKKRVDETKASEKKEKKEVTEKKGAEDQEDKKKPREDKKKPVEDKKRVDIGGDKSKKIVSGNKLAKHPGASAWRTALADMGYLNSSEFKKFPKKGTTEYSRVKELQKAYENKI